MVKDLDDSISAELLPVLESAARLQELVPDAVLVGGTVAALYAGHRMSYDHVVSDLRQRFDLVLDALDREPDWVLNRATPGKIIVGELGEIEAGVRQLIRTRPLETQEVGLPSGHRVVVPTRDEILRIKAFLIVRRNQTRDFLDVADLSKVNLATYKRLSERWHTWDSVKDQVQRVAAHMSFSEEG